MTDFETHRIAHNEVALGNAAESIGRPEPCNDSNIALGPVLDRLEAQGAIVIHGIPGEGFRLEHVAIHPTGVYVLEDGNTAGTQGVVNFDGTTLSLNGAERSDALITRARAAGTWLQQLLQASTGRPVLVRPTLVFPGGLVESEQPLDADMLVVSPGALPGFVANARPVLSREDVMLVAYHLSRYVSTRRHD